MALTPQEELELLDLEEQELMLEDEAARAPKEAAPKETKKQDNKKETGERK